MNVEWQETETQVALGLLHFELLLYSWKKLDLLLDLKITSLMTRKFKTIIAPLMNS